MQYPAIVSLILAKGVDHVSIPDSIKFQSLTEAGSLLLKENRYEESAKAFAKANNQTELIKIGDWLFQQTFYKEASYFYQFTNDKTKIENCAHACINVGLFQEAKTLFLVTNNQSMILFLSDNFNI
jgi:hypothetical protein